MMKRSHICPVCDYDLSPEYPDNYNICPQCGTEFGNDDENFSHKQLREKWIAGGRKFWFKKRK
jgi:predicted amidophosphoribosyltransferase